MTHFLVDDDERDGKFLKLTYQLLEYSTCVHQYAKYSQHIIDRQINKRGHPIEIKKASFKMLKKQMRNTINSEITSILDPWLCKQKLLKFFQIIYKSTFGQIASLVEKPDLRFIFNKTVFNNLKWFIHYTNNWN